MHFDLTDLRLFVNIDAAGTITGGAEASHMTLASASERIRALEASLGAALLVRHRRGVSPTNAGRTLVHHARRVLHQVDQLQSELDAAGSGPTGHVRLLCNSSALDEHLPPIVARFLGAHPGVSVDLAEAGSGAIADALRNGLADVGVAADSADLGGLEVRPFRADPLCLVVPKAHRLVNAGSVAFADTLDESFVGLGADQALQAHLADQARRLGRRIAVRLRLGSFEAVCRVVGQAPAIGVAVVPRAIAARAAALAPGLCLVDLTDDWARRSLLICVRDEAALAPAARALVDYLSG